MHAALPWRTSGTPEYIRHDTGQARHRNDGCVKCISSAARSLPPLLNGHNRNGGFAIHNGIHFLNILGHRRIGSPEFLHGAEAYFRQARVARHGTVREVYQLLLKRW
jgi:hypothetical protein